MTDPPVDPPPPDANDRPTPTAPVTPRRDDPLEAAVRAHERTMFIWCAALLIAAVLVVLGALLLGRL